MRLPLLIAITSLVAVFAALLLRRPAEIYTYDADSAVYIRFSGALALAHVEKLVAFGARPAGSEALEQSRRYLEETLTGLGWTTERQTFDDQTPQGTVSFANVRARFLSGRNASKVWQEPVRLLVSSHYDTKPYSDFEFLGANDSGSSTGALLEIARVVGEKPSLAKQLELIFFDGEEAFEPNITSVDGLYGSRHYAKYLRKLPQESKPKYGVNLDMIGDKDLLVRVPADSPPTLARWLTAAAKDLNYSAYFGTHPSPILDDHVPLNDAGVPTIDIIDLDYKPWHTQDDTMEQLSAESLHITGKTALLFIEKYLLGQS